MSTLITRVHESCRELHSDLKETLDRLQIIQEVASKQLTVAEKTLVTLLKRRQNEEDYMQDAEGDKEEEEGEGDDDDDGVFVESERRSLRSARK